MPLPKRRYKYIDIDKDKNKGNRPDKMSGRGRKGGKRLKENSAKIKVECGKLDRRSWIVAVSKDFSLSIEY
jgi:hypothetical protein